MGEASARDKKLVEESAAQAPVPPAGIKRDMPARDGFFSSDESGRIRLAAERQELILLCDPAGTVAARYSAGSVEELAALERVASVGSRLDAFLPPAEGKDAMDTLHGMSTGGAASPRRDYTIPLPGGTSCAFEWGFAPAGQPAPGGTNIVIFIRPSIYEVLWQKFRKHVYRDEEKIFWANNYGFRGNDIAVPKPPGVYRVLCIGGSTTEEGPRNDLTYPGMLERRLREYFGTEQIEVVNAGVSALNSDGEALNIDDYLAVQPDLIVHYNFINDLGNHLSFLTMQEDLSPKLGKRLKHWLRKSCFLQRWFSPWLLPPREEWEDRLAQSSLANLSRICDAAANAHIEMAVCSFAYPTPVDPLECDYFNRVLNSMTWGRVMSLDGYAWIMRIYGRQVQDLCGKRGLTYVPVAENLKGGIDCFTDICHMHLAGIDRKAEIAFGALKDVIAAKWNRAPVQAVQ